mgnify:CR=1 FL=1
MGDVLRNTSSGVESEGSIYAEVAAENAIALEQYRWYPQRAGRVDLALPRALETGRIDDPTVRQELAKLLILARTTDWTARRARASAGSQGQGSGGSADASSPPAGSPSRRRAAWRR